LGVLSLNGDALVLAIVCARFGRSSALLLFSSRRLVVPASSGHAEGSRTGGGDA
jgi:hypothetical protein